MNLIDNAWIPVRRKNGEKTMIAPWQITEGFGTDSEIIELAAVRPDFNGALIQLLIGLLQTVCAPKGNSDWRAWFNKPPSIDELRKKFASIVFAFNLDGDGPRFMQDLKIDNESPKVETIEKLLIDAPGESTLGKNVDLFNKRNKIKRLCLSCCGQALLTLQINAQSGGQGHRVGLRGGGPVNTIIMADSLWQTLWCNVLSEDEFAVLAAAGKSQAADKFPWCAETRTSENDRSTTPQDVHPAQVYWSMPRRMRLKLSDEHGACDLCKEMGPIVKEYYTKPYGIKYDGFVYPLTPTYKNKDEMVLSVHQHEPLGYKHWLGYVQNTDQGAERARVIAAAFSKQLSNFRLWAFGYDMNKMMASCWYEGVMPIVFIKNEEQWKRYNKEIEKLIQSADAVRDYVSKAVVKAMNKSVFNVVRQRFWQETEAEFYRQAAFLREEIIQDRDVLEIRNAWYKYLVEKSSNIFDDMSQAEMIEDVNAERVAKAYNELRSSLDGKKLKIDILGLPQEVKEDYGNKNSNI